MRVSSLRRSLCAFVMWQWRKMSRISAIVYSFVYKKINGNEGGQEPPIE